MFWLMQALGWSLFLAIAYLARPSEDLVPAALQGAGVVSLSVGGMIGSLALRWIYRTLQADGYGELRWLGLLFVSSLAMALGVDLAVHGVLWALRDVSPAVRALHESQPMISGTALLLPAYIAWSLLYLSISRQTRLADATRHQNDLRLALKEAQLQRLLGHISPHFTFNTLNNIRALILMDPELAREQITRFASTLRYQFSGGEEALVTVDEEMAVVRDYLGLVGMQLGKRLRYAEQVDAQARPMRVPRFCVQLLVENAIKHGLGPSSSGGDLQVDIALHGTRLQIRVSNTGQLVHSDGSGTGLANLRQRLQLSFGTGAGLGLDDAGGHVVAQVWIGGIA
ncbi:histidine kinase [Xanthomonas cassavae CFBP 4642]|uniref:Histidine kinase n=1 Tax=Xanthomonas cassavae CFBP 4642 TaxID=1219375 RepID=A0ABS8HME0_9XANT|nr:histidine kinase [Xanthomonas cassavae]MCC4621862.1 histidine kinase [Xanthomonas cassavae CFBP 4642]